jgi:hypothetical protein
MRRQNIRTANLSKIFYYSMIVIYNQEFGMIRKYNNAATVYASISYFMFLLYRKI